MDHSSNQSPLQNNTMTNRNKERKKEIRDYFPTRDNGSRSSTFNTKAIQVNIETRICTKDISSDSPSETYWRVLAEKRRVALNDTLRENKALWKEHDTLKNENDQQHKLLNEANNFIEVVKALIQDTANDTGIDCGEDFPSYEN